MKVIGHRGAAGLALENTLSSIAAANLAGVDGIEIDVRLTSDNHFILSHDANLKRVTGQRAIIANTPLKELRQLRFRNGERPATLKEALAAAGDTVLIIEAKSSGWAELLSKELRRVDPQQILIIARDAQSLADFHKLQPKIPVYLVQRFNPIDVFQALQDAQRLGFDGIDLNFWLLNPFTYWLARRAKLGIIVYTVNYHWIAKFLVRLFPDIAITTNHPERLGFLRQIK